MTARDLILLGIIALLLVAAIVYALRHRHRCCGNCTQCHTSCGQRSPHEADKRET